MRGNDNKRKKDIKEIRYSQGKVDKFIGDIPTGETFTHTYHGPLKVKIQELWAWKEANRIWANQ